MLLRSLVLTGLMTAFAFAQGLPDRDKLTQEFVKSSSSDAAALELFKHFQMGGLRTVIRNLNELPEQHREQWGYGLKHMNLFRFRNDINGLLQSAKDESTKSTNLMLLSTMGRAIPNDVFAPFFRNASEPLHVRLAAGAGMIQIQNPGLYDEYYTTAEESVYDFDLDRNDFQYALLDKTNVGFFLYTKAKVEDKSPTHGMIVSAIRMIEKGDTEIVDAVLNTREKKYVPLLIHQAIRRGAPNLLQFMLEHKRGKRFDEEIGRAMPAAQMVAKYYDQLNKTFEETDHYVGPRIVRVGKGSGGMEGYPGGYAIVKVKADGTTEILEHTNPFGGTDNLKSLVEANTFPAHLNFEPQEAVVLLEAL